MEMIYSSNKGNLFLVRFGNYYVTIIQKEKNMIYSYEQIGNKLKNLFLIGKL